MQPIGLGNTRPFLSFWAKCAQKSPWTLSNSKCCFFGMAVGPCKKLWLASWRLQPAWGIFLLDSQFSIMLRSWKWLLILQRSSLYPVSLGIECNLKPGKDSEMALQNLVTHGAPRVFSHLMHTGQNNVREVLPISYKLRLWLKYFKSMILGGYPFPF